MRHCWRCGAFIVDMIRMWLDDQETEVHGLLMNLTG
jgi:hypothetical protein